MVCSCSKSSGKFNYSSSANWKDKKANHSISELGSHLIFWNQGQLLAFKEDSLPYFTNDNEITFNILKNQDWLNAIKILDSIQTTWVQVIKHASEEQLEKWSAEIANLCAHNAYHTGQIVYIRKQNDWWE
ncbi:hypothetical protein JQC67_09655 [Aurantibacter crassamenti]|uniref:hypothetical protein n=1 Tax=Aurantibacter crassamenti TaxID=1837375 RepID=UPI00193A718A|nr:hypothetical protein [Aurantibacter crassamenti]MBM1106401.1 hypothetical protein [Aurantibacter crassamenti]